MPAGPRTSSRTHPTRFCPKSTRVLPAGEVQILSGRSSSCRRAGRTDVRSEGGEVELGRVHSGPILVGKPGLQPVVRLAPGVDRLTVVKIVG